MWSRARSNRIKGVQLIPYRRPDLLDCRRVIVVEGEKAVDRLWQLGFAATCGPFGAGYWLPSYSEDLWRAGCVELVIIPDNDAAGSRFGNTVAAACAGYRPDAEKLVDLKAPTDSFDLADPLFAPLTVKIVRLRDLKLREDVVDWFDRGGTRQALVELIDSTPAWSPEAEERARLQRRRAQGAERARRWRARHRGKDARRLRIPGSASQIANA